jgi:hypothetical protein
MEFSNFRLQTRMKFPGKFVRLLLNDALRLLSVDRLPKSA